MTENARVLILGGTGAMGAFLVNLLSHGAYEVAVTSRKPHPAQGKVEYRLGNAKDTAFLSALLSREWDVIVDFMSYNTDEFKDRLGLLLGAAKQYIFLSSARVFSNSAQPIKEDSPRLLDNSPDAAFLSTDEYSLAKARQENLLFESGRKNWTIVRPYITYSEQRLQLGNMEKEEWLRRALNGKKILFPKDLLSKTTTMTYGEDVALGIQALMRSPGTLGEAFNITGRDVCTWGEVLDIYLEILTSRLGCRPQVEYQGLEEYLSWNHGKYQVIYDRMYNRVFDSTKINRLVDAGNFTPYSKGIRQCLSAFLDAPAFRGINWRKEGAVDRMTGERTPLGKIVGIKNKIRYTVSRHL